MKILQQTNTTKIGKVEHSITKIKSNTYNQYSSVKQYQTGDAVTFLDRNYVAVEDCVAIAPPNQPWLMINSGGKK